MDILLTAAGLLMALVAGVFLSFSDFVMRGLAEAPEGHGAAGMVGLNRTVYRSAFMGLLMGFAPGSLALAALALWHLDGAARVVVVAGTGAYILGVMAVTGLGNVPMNTRLDDLSRSAEGTSGYWPGYAARWTRLNHLRVAASTFAAAAWLMAAQLA
ncbi:DUF1772 domain-containing protein [Roseibacterium sp. SDUM158016]|uniref:anthrone oxygenase family protein n=1 Tax=Roseicyclus sediminis TaxID=2980997 RepID=UPI0021D26DED|nr:anthrone oxygenase family protein [Roseibacterium sp. SDUM158016]MCU4653964.1 DUF1772 domain-containing protein [Roseibacterium sp. SDUM158016]